MSDIYDELGKTVTAIEDERQEPCVGCGRVWYVIHHKDGLCQNCQTKGLPGRTELLRRDRKFAENVAFFLAIIFIIDFGLIVSFYIYHWIE